MKDSIKKILKEMFEDFEPVNMDVPKYNSCSYFTDHNKKRVCLNLNGLRKFLVYEMGLKKFMEKHFEDKGNKEDLTDRYQVPLKLLYNKGNFRSIYKVGDKYYLNSLKNVSTIYDNEKWHYVNKLNTNYSDLSELLTEFFDRTNRIDEILEIINGKTTGLPVIQSLELIKDELKDFLLRNKERILNELHTQFNHDYKEFVRNTKYNTYVGDKAENAVKKGLVDFGFTLKYQGGNGDKMDQFFGIDLMMTHTGSSKVFNVQVKNTLDGIQKDFYNKSYWGVDYFAYPPDDGGVIIINKKTKKKFLIRGKTSTDLGVLDV